MMQVVPKWNVTVSFAARGDVVFWVSDAHLSNVLRTVAGMDFSESGLNGPYAVRVSAVVATNRISEAGAAPRRVSCPLGHDMRYAVEDDRFHCHCGSVASSHGTIIVDPDSVDVKHGA